MRRHQHRVRHGQRGVSAAVAGEGYAIAEPLALRGHQVVVGEGRDVAGGRGHGSALGGDGGRGTSPRGRGVGGREAGRGSA